MKAEQTLGKLWEEFVHQDEGQTSGQMGPLQLCSVEKPGMQLNNASAQVGNGEPLGASRRGDRPAGGRTAPLVTELLPVPGFLSHHIWGRLASVEAPKGAPKGAPKVLPWQHPPWGRGSPPCRAGRQRGTYVPADLGKLVSLPYRERQEL